MHLLQPKPGWVEIDPDQLWDTIISVMKNAIKSKFFMSIHSVWFYKKRCDFFCVWALFTYSFLKFLKNKQFGIKGKLMS